MTVSEIILFTIVITAIATSFPPSKFLVWSYFHEKTFRRKVAGILQTKWNVTDPVELKKQVDLACRYRGKWWSLK